LCGTSRLRVLAKTILLRDYDGSEYSIETPLSCKVDLAEVKGKLGIPDLVNTRSFLIDRALVTLWAAANAGKTHEMWPDIVGNFGASPIPLLLFGGCAVRMHSPSSNQPGSPFYRNLKDVDFIVPKNRARDLVRLLTNLAEMLGTRYHHFVSTSDKAFNAMRGGRRYRMRTIDSVNEDGTPTLGMLDIMTDTVDLRHRVDVREDFENPARNRYTISLENFLLTKCQFIFDAPANILRQLKDTGYDYRVLNYPFLKSERIVIGMEEKDIRDVCAILADNPVGESPGSISAAKIKLVLERDKKFALTFRLNIQNLVDGSESLERLQFGRSTISRILEGANEILRVIPVVEKKWANPWWNLDVETPKIFGKVGG
jgi:hypothetical protein